MKISRFIIIISFLIFSGGCGEPPFKPVKNFDLDRYLGRWYEIARMPFSFEEGMINVTADYSLNSNGTVRVLNSGYRDGILKTAEGKAKFAGDKSHGYLKVSFFGPFYADYIIVELDSENYSWAMVASSDKYLWILAKEPSLDSRLKDTLTAEAAALGFDTSKLYFTPQNKK
jgi:apolipoprotein D and lipocalin family protein